MKFSVITIFCVLDLMKSISNMEIASGEYLFASALVSIIHKFYVKESNNIFITSNKDDPTHSSILQTMFETLDKNIATTWILHNQDYLNDNIDRFSNIILIDSYHSFRLIFRSITTTSFESFGYYTIVETNFSGGHNHESDLINIFRDLWESNIVNVNILTYSNGARPSILMHTYFPFASTYCREIVPVVWNSLDNGHLLQSDKQIFPSKTDNLFQCPISILVPPISPYIFTTGNNSVESYGFDGIEYRVLHELSKRLNFTLNITIYWEPNLGEFYGFNGSAGGAFGMILERKHDVLVGALIYEPYLKRIISSTIQYLYDDVVLVVPNPRRYSSFETLFFPFTDTTWITLASTLVIAVIAIKLLQRKREYYFVIVTGPKNTSPYLNLLRVLLTGSTSNIPKANFARFLVMVWILASFVLQNVYLGQLFDFIKSQKMVNSVRNVDELVEKGISIKIIEENFASFFIFDPRLQKLVKHVDPTSEWEFVTETESYITFEIQLNYDTQRKRDKGLVSYHQPRTIKIVSYGHIFYLSKRFFLKNSMDDKLYLLNENGFISEWGATYRDTPIPDDTSIPRQLNVSQILGVVQVWFGLLMLAIILFILEITYSRWGHQIP